MQARGTKPPEVRAVDSCLLAEGTVERRAEGARAGGTPGSGDDSVRDLEAFLAALAQSTVNRPMQPLAIPRLDVCETAAALLDEQPAAVGVGA